MDNNEKILAVEEKLQDIFKIIGVPSNCNTMDTPKRIAKMWVNELFSSMNNNGIEEFTERMTTFPLEGDRRLILVKNIPFTSMCEHHFMPFMGTVTVGYIPNEEIIGLSKIPRIIKYFSKRPQLQERFTEDIKNYLSQILEPLAVFVEVKATHTCVLCRGAESEAVTETLSWYGGKEDFKEFLNRR